VIKVRNSKRAFAAIREINMSGLLRNFITFLLGLSAYGSKTIGEVTKLSFWVTPLDSGIRVLKSDKYFQLAEAAQIDYLIKVGKFFKIIQSGASFVNVAQIVKFAKPVSIFSRIRVETQLVYADEKCAYFSHVMYSRHGQVAEVLVKMKFKSGRITVAPSLFLPMSFAEVPEKVLGLESALATL
jgi:acyl-CoA thioesterase FadM